MSYCVKSLRHSHAYVNKKNTVPYRTFYVLLKPKVMLRRKLGCVSDDCKKHFQLY